MRLLHCFLLDTQGGGRDEAPFLQSLVDDDLVAPELVEAALGRDHVLEAPEEELVLARLEEEPEDHQDHAILG